VQLEGRVGVREAGALKSGSVHGATSHDQFIEQFHETASHSVSALGQVCYRCNSRKLQAFLIAFRYARRII
jgi:hypothetical protein